MKNPCREIVSDGTIWGSEEWFKNRWESVPKDLKRKIIDHLFAIPDLTEVVKDKKDNPWWHFTAGMGIRNYLREVVKDNELPTAPYPDGESYRNWDDYYIQALEAADKERKSNEA